MIGEITVTASVPVPGDASAGPRAGVYPFAAMQVGQSFWLPGAAGARAWAAARTYKHRHPSWDYVARADADGVRVWCVNAGVRLERAARATFGGSLRGWRTAMGGITVRSAAERLGVSERAWAGWESGRQCNASEPMLAQMRAVLARHRAETGAAPARPSVSDMGPSIPMGGAPGTGG